MDSIPLTSVFSNLPAWAKQKIDNVNAHHSDWKRCQNCGVPSSSAKLMACARCRPFAIVPVYYCVSTVERGSLIHTNKPRQSKECQKIRWPDHKNECRTLVSDGARPDHKRFPENYNAIKQLQRWHHIYVFAFVSPLENK